MIPLFDAHFDLLSEISFKRKQGKSHVFRDDFYPRFKKGGVKIVIASIYLQGHELNQPFYYAMEQLGFFYEELRESPELLMLIRTKEDLALCQASDKIGLLLSFEGAEPLLKPRDLYVFYELGVRLLGLSWSRRNIYADGCDFVQGPSKKGGLSPAGHELMELAHKLGIIPDVSHLSDEGLEDIIRLDIPLIASHSNANSITPTPRSLKDKYLDILRKKDFGLGVNGAHFIISRDEKTSSIEDFIAHMDYLIKKLGQDKVGLGLDLCSCLSVFKGDEIIKPEVIAHHGQAQQLLGALEDKFGPEITQKIAFDNWYNFFSRHLP
ncbi:MAG TPA: membrane dipeptidase [Clostridia bacterium]|nr:membrane dipeptidase [Clostridia bacterium]